MRYRVRRLESEGYISGYAAHIDEQRVGVGITMLVSVTQSQTEETEPRRLRDALLLFPREALRARFAA